MDQNRASTHSTSTPPPSRSSQQPHHPDNYVRRFRYDFYVNPATKADESEVEPEPTESQKRRRNRKKRARASQLKAGGLTSYRSSPRSVAEGPRRMARFDWTLGEEPRPLSTFSRCASWALLHCLWYDHHIGRDAELEALSGTRSPWRSCWSGDGFARAWEELTDGLDNWVIPDMRLPVAGDALGDRQMRTNLEWGVRRGQFAPPHENRYQGDNFSWLSEVFEKYNDFCVGKRHLWGREAVPRTPLEKIQDLLDGRNRTFRSVVTRVWSDSPSNGQNTAFGFLSGDRADEIRTESKILGVAYAILVCGLRRFYMGHGDHKCPGCTCCCMFDCCYVDLSINQEP